MKTEINYLFDVDGTLTPSRGVIEPNFAKWFLNFCKRKNVILVTGSDRPKTLISFGENIKYRRKVIQDLGELCYSKNYNCGNIGLVVHVVDAKTGDYYIGDRLIDKTVSPATRQKILHNVLKSF